MTPPGPQSLSPADAVLFDLDETLAPDTEAAHAAFRAVCEVASRRRGVDAAKLYASARARSRELWHGFSLFPYCLRIGISSWEGLWAGFAGDRAEARALREWAPEYRRQTWAAALAEQGVVDETLAQELAARFPDERRARQASYPEVREVLQDLAAGGCRLALVTDGAPDLQREKADLAGLSAFFQAVVVSGEIGAGKPGGRMFTTALERLGVPPERAVMVGDSLRRDIGGAKACGIRAVLIERGEPAGGPEAGSDEAVTPDARISDLRELPPLLRLP